MVGVRSNTDVDVWILCPLKFPSGQRIVFPMMDLNRSQHGLYFYVQILSFQDIYQGLKEVQNRNNSVEEEGLELREIDPQALTNN